MDLPHGVSTLDKAGVASTSKSWGGGAVPGFQGPLFWINPGGSLHTLFSDTLTPRFIVLLESRIPGKSLGRFNSIALGDLIDSIISDTKRQIFPNGRNQATVFCDRWQAANVLVDLPDCGTLECRPIYQLLWCRRRRFPGKLRRSIRPPI